MSQNLSKQVRYPKQVFWSDEDEGYIAIAPDLPGSSAFGESESEALRELDDAITGWIAAAKAIGNPVPPPSTPGKQHSGKLLVRMPRILHRDLAEEALREGVSLNQYVVFVLSKRFSARTESQATDRQKQSEILGKIL
jgi:predicted RNase H-like HicB family nuclease